MSRAFIKEDDGERGNAVADIQAAAQSCGSISRHRNLSAITVILQLILTNTKVGMKQHNQRMVHTESMSSDVHSAEVR